MTDKDMTISQARSLLDTANVSIKNEVRLPNDTGIQLHLENGVKVNIYDTGKFHVQSKKNIKNTKKQ